MAIARRNHHLIKGEGVKWSQEGLTNFYPMAEPFDRGVVKEVTKDGYMVAWDTGFLQALKGSVPVGDHHVVSAGSTSRSWPGTDFEGEAPRARSNKGKPMTAKQLRTSSKYKALPTHVKQLFNRMYSGLKAAGHAEEDATRTAWKALEKSWEYGAKSPRARKNKGKRMASRFARRNVDYTDPSGKIHPGLSVPEYLEMVEHFEGGYVPPSKPSRKKPSRKSKKWDVSDEKRAEPLVYGQARNIGHHIGGFAEYCPQAVQVREHGGKVSHLETLSGMGLTTFGQASDILDAMKDAGVNLWYDKRTAQSKKKARQILSQHGVACPI